MTELMTIEAGLRTVAMRLVSEPAARVAPDAADWLGPAREAYSVLHGALLRTLEEALQAVEQAQWRVRAELDAGRGIR